jgi:Zn finger protein HypA/HybF involved in hydrogenase expression
MSRKLTARIINERLANFGRGIRMVGEYAGIRIKTTFVCAEGHEWEAIPHNVSNGSGCPHCSGNVRLTTDLVNERLADRGIRLVGECGGANTRVLFACTDGHEWVTTPGAVVFGSGCPHCSGNASPTSESINKRLADRGIRLAGEYLGAHVIVPFVCSEDHQWEARPHYVLRSSTDKGCPHCAGKATVTREEAAKRLSPRGICIVGDYVNAETKTTFRCREGHHWVTSVEALAKSGCPQCANYGFQVTKPAEFYYARVLTESGNINYMIGITNRSFEDRYTADEHMMMDLLQRIQFDTGVDALAYETELKAQFKHLLQPDDVRSALRHKGNTTSTTEIFIEDILGLD